MPSFSFCVSCDPHFPLLCPVLVEVVGYPSFFPLFSELMSRKGGGRVIFYSPVSSL